VGSLVSREPGSAAGGTQQPPMTSRSVPHGRHPVPGPTRRFDRRHFARLEGGGMVAIGVIVLLIVWFWAGDIGLWHALFGWKR
jgi:hypothetical protein